MKDARDLGVVAREDDGILVRVMRYEVYGVRSGSIVGVGGRHGAVREEVFEGRVNSLRCHVQKRLETLGGSVRKLTGPK